MTILVAGATGATGLKVLKQLIDREHTVKAIVRSPEKIPAALQNSGNLSLICADLLDLHENELTGIVKDCDAVVSCLGHNMTLKGIFGPPKKLVTRAVGNLCDAIKKNNRDLPVRFVLMNTTGNKNRDLNEKRTIGEIIVIALIRFFIPPQADNEKAAEYLRTGIGRKNSKIEWVAVRPDGLINNEDVSPYTVYPSPVRSPIFNPGQTSRINVGHFMAELLTDTELWNKWKGRMPVIYNRTSLDDINNKF